MSVMSEWQEQYLTSDVAANSDKPCTNPLGIERLIYERP